MRLLVPTLFAGVSGLGVAAGCPAIEANLPRSAEEITILLRQAEVYSGLCAQDASWFAERGALMLSVGRYAEAAESLERAILLAPTHGGARVDYADALAALGDTAGALALVDVLLASPGLPLQARAHLENRVRQWRETIGPVRSPAQYHIEAGVQTGWESNLNGGPAADSVVLTPPEGAVRLPLDGSMRPRSGVAMLWDVDLKGMHDLGADWLMLVHGQVRVRDAESSGNDYVLSQADVSGLRRSASGDLSIQLGFLNQHLGGVHLLEERRLVGQFAWGGDRCRPALGTDVAFRNYPAASALDGTQYGVRFGLQCSGTDWRLISDFRVAEDSAQSVKRPGGRQLWSELHLGGVWQEQWGSLKADLNLGAVSDAEGYSSLLASNAPRKVWRSAARLELAHPVSRHWELAASLEYFRQKSNIGLFGLDNTGLYFGARYRY